MQSWMKRFTLAGALATGLAVGACASSHGATKIDESRLAGVAPQDMQPVNDAQNAVKQAEQDLESAKASKLDADNHVKLVQSEVDVADKLYEQAKARQDIAAKQAQQQAMGTLPPEESKISPIPTSMKEAKLNLDASKAKLDYAKTLDKMASADEDLAKKNIDLAKSKVEMARFDVLNQTNPAQVQAMKINAAQFQSEVSKKQADAQSAESKVNQLRAEARQQYEKWTNLDKQLGEAPMLQQRRAELPKPPQG